MKKLFAFFLQYITEISLSPNLILLWTVAKASLAAGDSSVDQKEIKERPPSPQWVSTTVPLF